MHSRVGGFVHMRLGTVWSDELNVVAGADQRHYRDDSFVEIIARWPPTAALDFNPGGIGSNHKHRPLPHSLSLLPCFWMCRRKPFHVDESVRRQPKLRQG